MSRPIGYYVHHHGAGHLTRALAVADAMPGRVTLIGTGIAGRTGGHACLDLPDDRLSSAFDGSDGSASTPAALHYAPLDHDGIRRRVAAVTGWIAAACPALMVVDVSCEIAMLARLASVPIVYVRLAGLREDQPHREAFRAARMVMAPFAAALDEPAVPDWLHARTVYCPGLVARPASAGVAADGVVVVLGGGSASDAAVWARAARQVPDRAWSVIGHCAPVADLPANLVLHGWVEDAADRIARAAIVVGGAGDGVVGAALAARRPFVCLPEDRPFAEQRGKAARLAAVGAAVTCDDAAQADWPDLLAQAARLDPAAAAALDDDEGAARLAARLHALAEENMA